MNRPSLHRAAGAALLFFGLALAACGDPLLEGFHYGGQSGWSCPPGTEASGSCSGDDCEVDCQVTTRCPNGDECPVNTTCSFVEDELWCAPVLCEQQKCPSTAQCDTQSYSREVCVAKAPGS